MGHDTGASHPEHINRIKRITEMLEAEYPDLLDTQITPASPHDFKSIHAPSYIDDIINKCPAKEGEYTRIDSDTLLSYHSWDAICFSSGCVLKAAQDILDHKTQNAFCAIRPPGHHAEYDKAMGFCFINHIFLAASYLRNQRPEMKFTILDFDVHHGNGTADLTRRHHKESASPNIYYISTHESPLFPGTGSTPVNGEEGVWDTPYPPATGSQDFRMLYDQHVIPLLESLNPDIILVSAGFDAHHDDPLSTARLNDEDFEYITHRLKRLRKPILSALEGGYNLDALETSIIAHINALE